MDTITSGHTGNTTSTTSVDFKIVIRMIIIVVLSIVLVVLLYAPGWGNLGPAPQMTGKIISIVPATAQDHQILGTVLIQRNDGYQLLLTVSHASDPGSSCTGANALHLSDIQEGETVTVRYWLDKPETSSNPHTARAVYINDRC